MRLAFLRPFFSFVGLIFAMGLSGCTGETLTGSGNLDGLQSSIPGDTATTTGDTAPVTKCNAEVDKEDPCMACTCNELGEKVCAPADVGSPCLSPNCCFENATCQVCDDSLGDCPPSGLQCTGIPETVCEPGEQCTVVTAACINGACSCLHTSLPDNTPCVSDPNACTEGDSCQNGTCESGPDLPLTSDNPCEALVCIKGSVQITLLEGDCTDNNPCTLGDSCKLGQCIPESLVECPQGQCSQSYCDPDLGECVAETIANGTICAADDPCIILAQCRDGLCHPEIYRTCNDGDPCTTDACLSTTGDCEHTTITPCSQCESDSDCDDGDLCNGSETCSEDSGCQVGPALVCNDGDECTEDHCDPSGGCVFSTIEGCGEPPILECEGSSIEFDGNSCITIPDILQKHPDALTIEFWVSISDPEPQTTILDKRDAVLDDPGFEIRSNFQGSYPERLHFDENRPPKGSASGIYTSTTYKTGEWHHFAITRAKPEPQPGLSTCTQNSECDAGCPVTQGCTCADSPLGGKECVATCVNHLDCINEGAGKTQACLDGVCRRYTAKLRIFADGTPAGSPTWPGAYPDLGTNKSLHIGCRWKAGAATGTNFFLGRIEELRISDIIRYEGSFSLMSTPFENDANTIALYHFEEGSGSTIVDSSGNGFHGEWSGTPLWDDFSPLLCPDSE